MLTATVEIDYGQKWNGKLEKWRSPSNNQHEAHSISPSQFISDSTNCFSKQNGSSKIDKQIGSAALILALTAPSITWLIHINKLDKSDFYLFSPPK